jgi:hypothetical protein
VCAGGGFNYVASQRIIWKIFFTKHHPETIQNKELQMAYRLQWGLVRDVSSRERASEDWEMKLINSAHELVFSIWNTAQTLNPSSQLLHLSNLYSLIKIGCSIRVSFWVVLWFAIAMRIKSSGISRHNLG